MHVAARSKAMDLSVSQANCAAARRNLSEFIPIRPILEAHFSVRSTDVSSPCFKMSLSDPSSHTQKLREDHKGGFFQSSRLLGARGTYHWVASASLI